MVDIGTMRRLTVDHTEVEVQVLMQSQSSLNSILHIILENSDAYAFTTLSLRL